MTALAGKMEETNGAALFDQPAPGHEGLSFMPKQGYKRCSAGCGEDKPLDQFHRATKAADGRFHICKACANARRREWSRGVPGGEWTRKKQNADPERLAETRRKKMQNERERSPEKFKARAKLKYAVHTGKVIKPTQCESCDIELPKPEIQGHHPDYSKPLEVEWLCAPCHFAAHGKKARIAIQETTP